MRSSASTARSRISSVTCRFGHSVDAEKNPAITASSPVVTAVRSPGSSVPISPAHHAEVLAQLGQVPALAAEDAHLHPRLHDGINLAGHGQNQRRLAAAVRPENRHMLAGANRQVHVVQHHALAARHVHLAQFEKLLTR